MLLISCPFCGLRNEVEFACGGQSHLARPEPYDGVSDEEWSEYLFFRTNPKGVSYERWVHRYGCRQWFNIARDTVTHKISAVYKMGLSAPSSAPGGGLPAPTGPAPALGAGGQS